MNIKRILGVVLILAVVLAVMVACKTPDEPNNNENENEAGTVEQPYELDIIVDGVSEYTLVYDDSSEAITEQVEALVKKLDKSYFVTMTAVGISKAEADYGKEIVVGDIRQSGRAVAKTLSGADFTVTVVEDDLVLCATGDRLYPYLFEVFAEEYLSAFENASLTVSSEQTMLWSTSKYKDTTYFERLSRGGVTRELIEEMFAYETFTAEDGTTLPYRIYVPYEYDEDKEYPVLLLLHGAGERGTDNKGNLYHMLHEMFAHADTPLADAIVIAPQCPAAPNQWVDTPWASGNYSVDAVAMSNELGAVLELLYAVEEEFSTDDDRYYIAGLSMGGFGTWDMIMRYPDVFAAAVPICGGADPNYAEDIYDMPIYTVHGSADPTVPVTGTRAMVEAIRALGGSVIYRELEGEGHGVWSWAAQNKDLWEWMFEQRASLR